MKIKKTSVKNNTTTSEGRRKFLKQTLAFAAITATYSVVSLTQLACHSDDVTSANGITYYY